MSFFKPFASRKAIVGVDIGTTSIKIAEMEKVDEKVRLITYGLLEDNIYLERFNEALQTSNLKLSEDKATRYLSTLLSRVHMSAETVIASIPSFLVFSTLIELPSTSDSEIKRVMELQAKQYIPLPLSAVTLDWLKIGERDGATSQKKSQILLVAIPNEQIERYHKIFSVLGLKLRSVEAEGMSLARSITLNNKDTSIIIDIGSRSSSFSVARGGFFMMGGQTDFSGGSLTQSIAKGLTISQRRAEDLKRERGLKGYGGQHELSTLMTPMLDVIISEAKRIISSFENAYGDKITRVLISGGGANLLGIEDYFNRYFGLPAKRVNPFLGLQYDSSLEPMVKSTGPLLSVALGLGMKEFI